MAGSTHLQKMRLGASVLLATCVTAVIVYMIAGWTLLDSVYMVAITVFVVGYGEVQPLDDPWLKSFTVCLVITGCSSGIYTLGGFLQMIAEGELHRALGARRMSRGIDQTSDHAIICGYGRVGQRLVLELHDAGVQLVVIDQDAERLAEAERAGMFVIVGDASQESVLMKAGVQRAKVLATVLPAYPDNVFVTLTARELNEDVEIIARGESEATERKLLRSGANRVVLPTMIGATKIANMIASPTLESLIDDSQAFGRLNQDLGLFGLEMQELVVEPNCELNGATIREIELTGDGGTVVVAIKRPNGQVLRNPKHTDTIATGDILVVLSHHEDMPEVSRRATRQQEAMVYRGTRYEK